MNSRLTTLFFVFWSSSVPFALAEAPKKFGGFIIADSPQADRTSTYLNFALMKVMRETDLNEDDVSWVQLEKRFDAGQLRKRDVSRAQQHFTQMCRLVATNDFEEAEGQVYRAERFISKAFPYSMNYRLMSEILYYRSVIDGGLKRSKKAKESYCNYLYLRSNLSRSPVSIGQKLSNLSSCEGEDETGELVVKTSAPSGIVFIDEVPVGIVEKSAPYSAPFLARGLHFVEVRRPGKARWGKVVDIKPGKSKKVRAKLKRPRPGVLGRELQPLQDLALTGEGRSGEDFIFDQMLKYRQLVGVDTVLFGKVDVPENGKRRLTLLKFDGQVIRTAQIAFEANTEDFELIILSALRQVEVMARSVSSSAPTIVPEFLFFKVR